MGLALRRKAGEVDLRLRCTGEAELWEGWEHWWETWGAEHSWGKPACACARQALPGVMAAGEDFKGALSRRKRTREDKSFVPVRPVVNYAGGSPRLQDMAPAASPASWPPLQPILFCRLTVPAVPRATHCPQYHQLVNFHCGKNILLKLLIILSFEEQRCLILIKFNLSIIFVVLFFVCPIHRKSQRFFSYAVF